MVFLFLALFWKWLHSPLPQYVGEKKLPSLQKKVDVYTDKFGVPHVFAENEDEIFYTAYVSQQNLLIDDSNEPVAHPDVSANFGPFNGKFYEIRQGARN